tara:strand:- start:45368 stop:45973 length:606 start_codon:yes stop_codon:yes gene_type:complete
MKSAGLILAAGQSSRMMQQKALLPWGDKTLIEWNIQCLQSAGIEKIFVVVGSEYLKIVEKIQNLNVHTIINHDWAQGRNSSILSGVKEILSYHQEKKIDNFLVQNVDQPLTIKIITEIMDFVKSQKNFEVIQPFFNNKNRHPVIFHINQANKLLNIKNHKSGLRSIIQELDVKTITIDSRLLNINLNYISDYHQALKKFNI